MKYFVILLILLFGGCAMADVQRDQGMDRFDQDRLAIGFWVDPPADENMDQRYKEIADANFTLVIGGFGAKTPENVQRQLDLCEKYDLKALVSLPGYRAGAVNGQAAIDEVRQSDKFPDHPAMWGFLTKDEPNTAQFANLAFLADHLRKTRPGKLAYINLYPNYVNLAHLGVSSYDEHIRRFIEEVDPDVLSMDHYPLMKPDADSRDNYCKNLEVMRKYSRKAGIPFWNFFNIMPFGPHLDPTEAQVRWQIYTSLAYGAKGVLYFCYYTPSGPEFPKGGAIISQDDTKTRHYDEAKRINAELKHLGPTLMKATSKSIYRITPEDKPDTILRDTVIKSISEGNYLIGTFNLSDGREAVLINNYSHCYSSWPTVEFDRPMSRVSEIDKSTGEERPPKDDSPDMEGLQVSLDSGDGRLFVLK